MDLISFKPEILERIIPDVSLDRHLRIGIRSNHRQADEFKDIQVLANKSNDGVTSSYIKNGNTMIICNITYGINEVNNDFDHYTSVYPTVSISRGRSGAPTDEEMNLSQQLYELILTSKLLPVKSLKFKPKLLVDGKLQDFPANNKWFKFNIFVNFKIFDRSGPLLSICHYSLLNCLKHVKLPTIYLDDSFAAADDSTTNSFSKLSADNLKVYPDSHPLELNLPGSSLPVASNFGFHQLDDRNLIICDLENESEEYNILTKAQVIANGTDNLSMSHFNFVNGNLLDISKDDLKQIISHSHTRAVNLDSK